MIPENAFVHPEAVVIGDVQLGANSSVWPTAVIRGDSDRISVGAQSNIQDGAVLHGATVEDNCLIGMGAIVLNHAVIGEGSLIGAGAVVPEDMVVPPGSIVLGVPGRVVKPVDKMTRARIQHGVDAYLELAAEHRAGKYPRQGKGK